MKRGLPGFLPYRNSYRATTQFLFIAENTTLTVLREEGERGRKSLAVAIHMHAQNTPLMLALFFSVAGSWPRQESVNTRVTAYIIIIKIYVEIAVHWQLGFPMVNFIYSYNM